jgi:hypothetical protein
MFEFQETMLYFILIVFVIVSPILNIIYVPTVYQDVQTKRKIRFFIFLIYLLLLSILYWCLFIIID